MSKKRNLAVKKSKDKYIAFIDSDDIWKKEKLKHLILMSWLLREQGLKIVLHPILFVCPQGVQC